MPSPSPAMQVQRARPAQMMQPSIPGHVPSPVGQNWGHGTPPTPPHNYSQECRLGGGCAQYVMSLLSLLQVVQHVKLIV